ncbi:MAG: hypothetical protein E6L02_04285 [Thaumarchaeota archaeon]|nr:MAG: hypothetical protein E6L02_04285 [Nitrososphaerota archaeon]
MVDTLTVLDSVVGQRDGKFRVWLNGQVSLIDPIPNPNFFYTEASVELPISEVITNRPDLKTIDTDQPVKKYTFPTQDIMQRFASTLKSNKIPLYESDKNPVERWMLENNIICSDYPNRGAWDTEVDDSNGDPDELTANRLFTAIGVWYKGKRETWTVSHIIDKAHPVTLQEERLILLAFIQWLREEKIQLLQGWNSRDFDVPYLSKRLYAQRIEFDMSSIRWVDSSIYYRYMEKNYKSQWGLAHVDRRILGDKKPFIFRKISSLSMEERSERVGWDAESCGRIDEVKNYTNIAIEVAKKANIFPDKILSINPTTNLIAVTPALDQYFIRRGIQTNRVLPDKRKYERGGKFPGGLVEIMGRGNFENIMQFDFDSLYPNVIKAFKLAPFGKTDYLFPIIDEFLIGKKQAPTKSERMAYKILANATFGIFSSAFYRFHTADVSANTAANAKKVLSAVAEFLRSLGYVIRLMDTDSAFIQVKSYEEREHLEIVINEFVQKRFNVTNLRMKFEAFWSFFALPRGATKDDAKKKYYGIVHIDKDGKVIDNFEVAGMEELRGDWCIAAKEMQDAVMKMLCAKKTNKEILEWVESNVIEPLFAGGLDDKLTMEKTMSKKPEEYGQMIEDPNTGKLRKGPVPQHVRAFRAARAEGWVPSEMVRENRVYYVMCKEDQPKLVNMAKKEEISHEWYYIKQIMSLLYRLAVIDEIPKKRQSMIKDQSSLEVFWT